MAQTLPAPVSALGLSHPLVCRFRMVTREGSLRGEIDQTWDNGVVVRAQTRPGGRYRRVHLPGFRLIDPRSTDDPPWGRPSAGFFRTTAGPILWTMAVPADDGEEGPFGIHNPYEIMRLILLRREETAWVPMPSREWITFTHRGGCAFVPNGVLVWDYLSDNGHSGPSRYRVRLYGVAKGQVVVRWVHDTRREYRPREPGEEHATWPPPDRVPEVDDPLREFGYRWTWWASRLPARKARS